MILEYPGTLGLIDDAVVYKKNKIEHDQNLRNLMKPAQAEGFPFNGDKCVINRKKMIFLGSIYNKNKSTS